MALKREVYQLRSVCWEARHFAVTVGAPVRVLANLAAAAEGHPLPHASFLPVSFEECRLERSE